MTRRARVALLLAVAVGTGVAFALASPIPQDPEYHRFADARGVLGIANFADVVSNVGFAVVGAAGLAFVLSPRSGGAFAAPTDRVPYALFFFGVLATAAGSTWYHLEPTTERLFWDRLPMAVGFLALAAAMVGERVSRRAALALTLPAVALAFWSVLAWRASERAGAGDLRAYAAVQYGPILLIPLAAALFPFAKRTAFWLAIGFAGYGLAKAAEALDRPVFEALGVVSGHTLKHVFAAAGAGAILLLLRRRARDAGAGRPEAGPRIRS